LCEEVTKSYPQKFQTKPQFVQPSCGFLKQSNKATMSIKSKKGKLKNEND